LLSRAVQLPEKDAMPGDTRGDVKTGERKIQGVLCWVGGKTQSPEAKHVVEKAWHRPNKAGQGKHGYNNRPIKGTIRPKNLQERKN